MKLGSFFSVLKTNKRWLKSFLFQVHYRKWKKLSPWMRDIRSPNALFNSLNPFLGPWPILSKVLFLFPAPLNLSEDLDRRLFSRKLELLIGDLSLFFDLLSWSLNLLPSSVTLSWNQGLSADSLVGCQEFIRSRNLFWWLFLESKGFVISGGIDIAPGKLVISLLNWWLFLESKGFVISGGIDIASGKLVPSLLNKYIEDQFISKLKIHQTSLKIIISISTKI